LSDGALERAKRKKEGKKNEENRTKKEARNG
jgi:hypothetical protein